MKLSIAEAIESIKSRSMLRLVDEGLIPASPDATRFDHEQLHDFARRLAEDISFLTNKPIVFHFPNPTLGLEHGYSGLCKCLSRLEAAARDAFPKLSRLGETSMKLIKSQSGVVYFEDCSHSKTRTKLLRNIDKTLAKTHFAYPTQVVQGTSTHGEKSYVVVTACGGEQIVLQQGETPPIPRIFWVQLWFIALFISCWLVSDFHLRILIGAIFGMIILSYIPLRKQQEPAKVCINV